MIRNLALVYVALAFFLSGCATPPPVKETLPAGDYSYVIKQLSWLIDDEMRQNEITGVSIALVDDQKVIWAKGFGYADLENRIPATPDTVYRAGSIAKVFTAAAVMQLADQGKIAIDHPLGEALPKFSIRSRFPSAAPVTPRNILCHHSGLPSNFLKGLYVRDPERFDTVVDEIHDQYLAFPPNYVFSYSNLGMALLGAAVENVSGETFNAYMEHHFFAPLHMTQSSFARKAVAKAYDHNQPIEVFSLRDMPAANLLSSATDLVQFLKMQFADGRYQGNTVLSPQAIQEMVRVQNRDFPMTFGQFVGLGWMMSGIDVPGGGPVASHGGSLPDSHSMLAMLPQHKLGIVVLSNSATSHVAVSKIAGDALRLMLEAKTGVQQIDGSKFTSAERKATPDELRRFSGDFDTMVGYARISTESGNIDVEAVGHQFRLVPHENGQLTIKYKVFGMLPVRVGAFENIQLTMVKVDDKEIVVGHIGDESLIFGEKLKPRPIPQGFLQNLGQYEIVGKIDGPSPDRLSLKEEDGLLIGEARFPEVPDLLLRIAFTPISDSEVITAGLGTGRGDTLRLIGSGRDSMLEFSGLQIRRKLN